MSAPLHIHLTPGDEAPLYRQLVRQVVAAIASGHLAPGARLPSLRELAKTLVVAPLTVKKAYDVLEERDLIETRRGQGTFVRLDAGSSSREATERLRPLARRLLVEADLANVDPEALSLLLDRERTRLREERETREEAS